MVSCCSAVLGIYQKMTPEGICSREPRCRFDDCYFVIKVNRNKNELVTKQLIYSSAWPRRGSLGKAGRWCSHCWEGQAAPQTCPTPNHPLGLTLVPPALCLSKYPQQRPFCTKDPRPTQNTRVSGLKPSILGKMFQCCLFLYMAVGVGAGWSLGWVLDGIGIVCGVLDGAGTLHWALDRNGIIYGFWMEPGPGLGSGWNWDHLWGSALSWDPALGSRQNWDHLWSSGWSLALH